MVVGVPPTFRAAGAAAFRGVGEGIRAGVDAVPEGGVSARPRCEATLLAAAPALFDWFATTTGASAVAFSAASKTSEILLQAPAASPAVTSPAASSRFR
jgi:hypothetical protein